MIKKVGLIFGQSNFFSYICITINKKINNMAELTLNGTKGLELTREEVIDLGFKADALVRKAQCREVNQDVLDLIQDASEKLDEADRIITEILEGNYEG